LIWLEEFRIKVLRWIIEGKFQMKSPWGAVNISLPAITTGWIVLPWLDLYLVMSVIWLVDDRSG